VGWCLARPVERRLASGLGWREEAEDQFTIYEGDPLSATVRSRWSIAIDRAEWHTRVAVDSVMTADAASFHVTNTLEGFERHQRVFAKTSTFTIPRDAV
jgi:hypothetical protein